MSHEGDRKSLEGKIRRLEALRDVSLELTSERDLRILLTLIMRRASQILGAERSTLYLLEPCGDPRRSQRASLVSQVAEGIKEIRLPLDETSIAGTVALRGDVINLPDAYQDPRFNPSFDRHHGFRTHAVLAAPMRNHGGQTIGVTQAINKCGADRFDANDEAMLLALSSQAAIAVENARFLDLQRRTFETLINGQTVAIDARDHITAGHTRRVTAFAVQIGQSLGWKDQDLEILRFGGLLHDQGKLGVPDEILFKPTKLSDWEFKMIQSHAQKTKAILHAVRPLFPRKLRTLPEIAAAHHEKLDGSGYPDRLRGDAISSGSRILAVADIFDALTAPRPYRTPDSDEVAIEILLQDAEDGKLDAEVVMALIRVLPKIAEIREEINEKIQEARRIRSSRGSQGVAVRVEDSKQ
jgi:HD-GYP domain-containing protein (c-di-GMP phosphodiesterase class II)